MHANQPLHISVNGVQQSLAISPEASLLHLLRNDLLLNSPKYGCGLGECGACTVLVDGVAARSCVIPAAGVAGRQITTLEGLAGLYAEQKKLPTKPALHPLQQAFIDEQSMHCGYCYNGMTVKGAELLSQNTKPSDAQIRAHMDGHLCRCGTYPRVMKAIKLAANRMSGGKL
jgi:aerobic-type carbon monoxide dehydrogenase small subunit (CoxS/CutS family)